MERFAQHVVQEVHGFQTSSQQKAQPHPPVAPERRLPSPAGHLQRQDDQRKGEPLALHPAPPEEGVHRE
jgi:hypothetical protein